METTNREIVDMTGVREARQQRLFYSVFLPLGAIANLLLGLMVLYQMYQLRPAGELAWLQLGTGAVCCMIAGWLAASAWSKSYWSRSMTRQIAVWGRIADAFFAWMEEAQLPTEALLRLKSSLDEVMPAADR